MCDSRDDLMVTVVMRLVTITTTNTNLTKTNDNFYI